VVADTAYENLRIVPGTSGLLEAANPRYQQKQALIRELATLEADLIIVDLDAGAHLNTLDFFLITDTKGVLVITPEKTSIDNAFKFLRAALYRRIERFYQSPEVALLLRRNESVRDFVESIRTTDLFDEPVRRRLCGEIVAIAHSIRPKIVVNRARNSYEAQIAANILARLARQQLMVECDNLGFLYFDKCVPEAINSGLPFIVSHPKQKISACVADIANRLGYF
jgi:flagellar biosynthesis protein FlhG